MNPCGVRDLAIFILPTLLKRESGSVRGIYAPRLTARGHIKRAGGYPPAYAGKN